MVSQLQDLHTYMVIDSQRGALDIIGDNLLLSRKMHAAVSSLLEPNMSIKFDLVPSSDPEVVKRAQQMHFRKVPVVYGQLPARPPLIPADHIFQAIVVRRIWRSGHPQQQALLPLPSPCSSRGQAEAAACPMGWPAGQLAPPAAAGGAPSPRPARQSALQPAAASPAEVGAVACGGVIAPHPTPPHPQHCPCPCPPSSPPTTPPCPALQRQEQEQPQQSQAQLPRPKTGMGSRGPRPRLRPNAYDCQSDGCAASFSSLSFWHRRNHIWWVLAVAGVALLHDALGSSTRMCSDAWRPTSTVAVVRRGWLAACRLVVSLPHAAASPPAHALYSPEHMKTDSFQRQGELVLFCQR